MIGLVCLDTEKMHVRKFSFSFLGFHVSKHQCMSCYFYVFEQGGLRKIVKKNQQKM